MSLSVSPTQSQILGALRVNLLQAVLPQGSALFSGSIALDVLTVSDLTTGAVAVQDAVTGQGVSPGTRVLSQLTGPPGGAGTYKVSISQTAGGNPLATGVPVIQGQGNRVAEPPVPDFVIITPMGKTRLATNVDDYVDCYFQGALDMGGNLTVSSVAYGAVTAGSVVFGVGVEDGTTILSQTSGTPGGVGVYTVDAPQSVSAQGMACGVKGMLQEAELHVQIDFFGPNGADYAQIVSTVFRDPYGVELLRSSGLDIAPLYADDPKQAPFVDGEQQYENRWTATASVQANQTVLVPQQFAAALAIDLIEVDAVYPPT